MNKNEPDKKNFSLSSMVVFGNENPLSPRVSTMLIHHTGTAMFQSSECQGMTKSQLLEIYISQVTNAFEAWELKDECVTLSETVSSDVADEMVRQNESTRGVKTIVAPDELIGESKKTKKNLKN